MLLFIDTETTGKWHFDQPTGHPSQPHLVQLAAILCDPDGIQQRYLNTTIRPNGYTIPDEATRIHHITTEYALAFGEPLGMVVPRLIEMLDEANELQRGSIVAHNAVFDINVLSATLLRCEQNPSRLAALKSFCTMRALTERMALPGRYGKPKWPTLDEALHFIMPDAIQPKALRHTAMGDAMACRDIYLAGRERQWW